MTASTPSRPAARAGMISAGGDDLVRETFGSVLHCDGDTLSERIEDLLRLGEDLADVRARERA